MKMLLIHYWILLHICNKLLLTVCGLRQLNDSSFTGTETELAAYLLHSDTYDNLVIPSQKYNEPLVVNFMFTVDSLVSMDIQSQMLKTNGWLTLQWVDSHMKWSRDEFDNIEFFTTPHENVWVPDIVLYNNGDGQFDVSMKCNVLVYNTGKMIWIPPVSYTSYCISDVLFFPFDQQVCHMHFASWKYGSDQIVLDWYEGMSTIEHSGSTASWYVISLNGKIDNFTNPDGQVTSRVSYEIVLLRRTLFYTVNLIVPIVLTSFLTVCVFYLPTDSRQKTTLSISILTAMVFFLMIISKLVPPSDQMPLISQFLLFTFLLNLISIISTIWIVHVSFRTPRHYIIPNWMRQLFIYTLPKYLYMHQPSYVAEEKAKQQKEEDQPAETEEIVHPNRQDIFFDYGSNELDQISDSRQTTKISTSTPLSDRMSSGGRRCSDNYYQRFIKENRKDIHNALSALKFINSHMAAEDKAGQDVEDWMFMASVIDRIHLVIFTTVILIASLCIFMSSPYLFKQMMQGVA